MDFLNKHNYPKNVHDQSMEFVRNQTFNANYAKERTF